MRDLITKEFKIKNKRLRGYVIHYFSLLLSDKSIANIGPYKTYIERNKNIEGLDQVEVDGEKIIFKYEKDSRSENFIKMLEEQLKDYIKNNESK